MSIQIQLRRDTASNWVSNDPILAEGEVGVETDTFKFKIGDGSTSWNDLSYSFNSYYMQSGSTLNSISSQSISGGTILGHLPSSQLKTWLDSVYAPTGVTGVAWSGASGFYAISSNYLGHSSNREIHSPSSNLKTWFDTLYESAGASGTSWSGATGYVGHSSNSTIHFTKASLDDDYHPSASIYSAYDMIVYKNGSNYSVRNGSNGKLLKTYTWANKAIQYALDELAGEAHNAGKVYIQNGKYFCSSAIHIGTGYEGATWNDYAHLQGAGPGTYLMGDGDRTFNVIELIDAERTIIENLTIVSGNYGIYSESGSEVAGNSHNTFRNISIYKCSSDGMHLRRAYNIRLENIHTRYNSGSGIWVDTDGGGNYSFIGCESWYNKNYGYLITGDGATGVSFAGCTAEYNNIDGFNLYAVRAAVLNGCYAEGNGRYSYRLGGYHYGGNPHAHDLTMNNCYARSKRVLVDAPGCKISNCYIRSRNDTVSISGGTWCDNLIVEGRSDGYPSGIVLPSNCKYIDMRGTAISTQAISGGTIHTRNIYGGTASGDDLTLYANDLDDSKITIEGSGNVTVDLARHYNDQFIIKASGQTAFNLYRDVEWGETYLGFGGVGVIKPTLGGGGDYPSLVMVDDNYTEFRIPSGQRFGIKNEGHEMFEFKGTGSISKIYGGSTTNDNLYIYRNQVDDATWMRLNGGVLNVNAQLDMWGWDIVSVGDITIGGDINHTGDADTKIAFTPDNIALQAGGTTSLNVAPSNTWLSSQAMSSNLMKGGQLYLKYPTFPVLQVERETSATTGVYATMRLNRSTTSTAQDGMGGAIYFGVENDNGDIARAGCFGARLDDVTDGAEKMSLVFCASDNDDDPYNDIRMVVRGTGEVGIGDETPTHLLDVAGTIGAEAVSSQAISGGTIVGGLHYPADYVIYNEGSNWVARRGSDGYIGYNNTSPSSAIQYAIDNCQSGTVYVANNLTLDGGLVGKAHIILDFGGHEIIPDDNFDIITMKPKFQVHNVSIDSTSQDISGSAVFRFNGSDNYGLDKFPTRISNIYIRGYSLSGTGILMESSADTEYITDVKCDNITMTELKYGIRLVASNTDGSAYVNANHFDSITTNENLYNISLERNENLSLSDSSVDGNIFNNINHQTDTTEIRFLNVEGRYNQFNNIMVFDWFNASPKNCVVMHASSNRNIIIGQGIADYYSISGVHNTYIDTETMDIHGTTITMNNKLKIQRTDPNDFIMLSNTSRGDSWQSRLTNSGWLSINYTSGGTTRYPFEIEPYPTDYSIRIVSGAIVRLQDANLDMYDNHIYNVTSLSSQTISGGTIIGGLHYPVDYVIWKEDNTYYSKKASNGAVASDWNATTVINNAITDLSDGGIIHVSPGTYILSGHVNLGDNIWLRGTGDNTLFHTTSGQLLINGKSDVRLSDFDISGLYGIRNETGTDEQNFIYENITAIVKSGGTYPGSVAGFFTYLNSCTMKNIIFKNCKSIKCDGFGYLIDGENSPTVDGLSMYDCLASGCGVGVNRLNPYITGFDMIEGIGIARNYNIVGCRAESNWQSGFHFEYAPTKENVHYVNCTSNYNGVMSYPPDSGIDYYGAGFLGVKDGVICTNCTAIGNTGFGFVAVGGGTISNCYIDGDSDYGTRLGILGQINGNLNVVGNKIRRTQAWGTLITRVDNAIVSDNIFENIGSGASIGFHSGTCIQVQHTPNAIITNNICEGTASGNYSIVSHNASSNIQNNIIKYSRNYGIRSTGKTSIMDNTIFSSSIGGIYIFSGEDTIINDNRIVSCPTPILDEGTNTIIRNNIGTSLNKYDYISSQAISGGTATLGGYNYTTPPMIFNIANIEMSANQSINITRFDAGNKNVYVWQAAACNSGGSMTGGLQIELLSGSTSVYSTSSAAIQQGYPLATSDGGQTKIRFMYSSTTALTGIEYGTGFMQISVY